MPFKVRILNGTRRTNMAKRTYASYGARDAKGRLLPKGKRKRRKKRRSNPSRAVARRVSSSAPRRRRRRKRRSNPPASYRRAARRGMDLFWSGVKVEDIAGGVAGRLLMARITRWLGTPYGKSMFGLQQDLTSPFAGKAWSGYNYFLGLGSAWVVAQIVKRFRPRFARNLWRGALEDSVTRMIWTEGFARWPQGQQWFGQMPMMGSESVMGPGTVIDEPNHQRYIMLPDGNAVSMMGTHGFDAYSDSLVTASALDGLVESSPLDSLVPVGPGDSLARNRARVDTTSPYESGYKY